jgi:integrase
VSGFLPKDLVSLVEEFIAHHRHFSCATARIRKLCLDTVGGAASTKAVSGWVKKVASKYSEVPVTPHIFRDIVDSVG